MKTRTQRALIAGVAVAAVLALGHVTKQDAARQQSWLVAYCTDAAVWQAEAARGVPLSERTGAPDYRGIAAESCPGMRPAGPPSEPDRAPEWRGRSFQIVQF